MSFGTVLDQLMDRWRESPSPTRSAALADGLRKRGEAAEARRILADGIGRFPTFLPLLVAQARLAVDEGDRVALEQALETGLELEPDHPALRELMEMHWPERLTPAPPERLAFASETVVHEVGGRRGHRG